MRLFFKKPQNKPKFYEMTKPRIFNEIKKIPLKIIWAVVVRPAVVPAEQVVAEH
jgi:hypothetical protein